MIKINYISKITLIFHILVCDTPVHILVVVTSLLLKQW